MQKELSMINSETHTKEIYSKEIHDTMSAEQFEAMRKMMNKPCENTNISQELHDFIAQ